MRGTVLLILLMAASCGEGPMSPGDITSTTGAVKTPEETAQILADRNKEPVRKFIPYVPAPAALYEQGKRPVVKSKAEFLALYNAANRATGLPDVDFEAYRTAVHQGDSK